MAIGVDTLITNATVRTSSAMAAAGTAANNVITTVNAMSATLLSLDTTTSFPLFATTATVPNYITPTVTAPTGASLLTPSFAGIDAVTIPSTAPTLNTSGLFDFDAPSDVIATFDVETPTMAVAELVQEITAIAVPVLSTIAFPSITEITAADYTYTTPTYEGDTALGTIVDPDDYEANFSSSYASTKTATTSFLDDRVNDWITLNSPSFYTLRNSLEAKLSDAMTNGLVSDSYLTSNEAAIFARAQGRVETAASQAIATTTNNFNRGGFLSVTGAEASAIANILSSKKTDLSTQANEIYVQRRQQDIALYQDTLTRVSAQMTELRGLALQYSQQQLAMLQFCSQHTGELINRAIVAYEHFLRRGEWKVSALGALNQKFSNDLQSEQIKLDAARLNLIEQKKLVLDQETESTQSAAEQVKALELSVKNYSALVNATVQKAEIEKLKNANYSLQTDAYRIYADAAKAAFSVYSAKMDGDKLKYDAELKKYDLYQKQIEAATTIIEAQKTKLAATTDYNQSKLAELSSLTSVYDTALESSLKLYSAKAEVYRVKMASDVSAFQAGYESEKFKKSLLVDEYRVNTEKLVNQWKVSVDAYTSIMKGYFDVASASSQSLGTIVSEATQV